MQTLFRNIDASGDGSISKEEFSKLVESPMLQFWMGQLELEYHDPGLGRFYSTRASSLNDSRVYEESAAATYPMYSRPQ